MPTVGVAVMVVVVTLVVASFLQAMMVINTRLMLHARVIGLIFIIKGIYIIRCELI